MIARLRGLSVIAMCIAFMISGCSLTPEDLPSVRAGGGNDYQITAQFGSVMNLPTGADVNLDGLRVGQVEKLTRTSDGVDVTIGLKRDARVPADADAVIRQDTVLGDTYIALIAESDAGPGRSRFLEPGNVIPLSRTTSPPQLEDTLAVLAYFVNGGSIQKVQDVMGGLNRALPPLQELQKVAKVTATDLQNLSVNTGELDRAISGLDRTAVAFNDRATELRDLFSVEGTHYFEGVFTKIFSHISTILPSIGSVFEGGLWMVPMLESLADASESIRNIWDTAPQATTRLSNFLRVTLAPFLENPRVDIVDVRTTTGGKNQIADVETLMRMLGAIR